MNTPLFTTLSMTLFLATLQVHSTWAAFEPPRPSPECEALLQGQMNLRPSLRDLLGRGANLLGWIPGADIPRGALIVNRDHDALDETIWQASFNNGGVEVVSIELIGFNGETLATEMVISPSPNIIPADGTRQIIEYIFKKFDGENAHRVFLYRVRHNHPSPTSYLSQFFSPEDNAADGGLRRRLNELPHWRHVHYESQLLMHLEDGTYKKRAFILPSPTPSSQ